MEESVMPKSTLSTSSTPALVVAVIVFAVVGMFSFPIAFALFALALLTVLNDIRDELRNRSS